MNLRTTGLLLLMTAAFTITACGQKGPLYLPKRDTAAGTAASAEDASDKPDASTGAANGSVDSSNKGDSTDK